MKVWNISNLPLQNFGCTAFRLSVPGGLLKQGEMTFFAAGRDTSIPIVASFTTIICYFRAELSLTVVVSESITAKLSTMQ